MAEENRAGFSLSALKSKQVTDLENYPLNMLSGLSVISVIASCVERLFAPPLGTTTTTPNVAAVAFRPRRCSYLTSAVVPLARFRSRFETARHRHDP